MYTADLVCATPLPFTRGKIRCTMNASSNPASVGTSTMRTAPAPDTSAPMPGPSSHQCV